MKQKKCHFENHSIISRRARDSFIDPIDSPIDSPIHHRYSDMPNRRRASSKPFQFQWTLTLTLYALTTTLPIIANASSVAPATAWSTEFSEIFSADDNSGGLEDIHRVILKIERAFTAIGMGLFLDEATTMYRNDKDVSASKDANDAYNASTWMCRRGNALTTSDVVRVRMESLDRARRITAYAEWLSREFASANRLYDDASLTTMTIFDRNPGDAIETFRLMMHESFEVVSSGRCYRDSSRLAPIGVDDAADAETSDVRAIANRARTKTKEELLAVGMGYVEDTFYAVNNQTSAVFGRAFEAYDRCRMYGRRNANVVDADARALNAIRAHYAAVDYLLNGANAGIGDENVGSAARTLAFLVNAAYDVLRSDESCAAAPKILPGRYFASESFDAIMAELSRDCGLASIGLTFIDNYSRGHGSHLLHAQLEEISRHLKECEADGNTTVKSAMFSLNERAIVELVGGLEIIDAAITGCHRGSVLETTTASRLARALLEALQTFRANDCFAFTAGDARAVAVAAAAERQITATPGDFDAATVERRVVTVSTTPGIAWAFLNALLSAVVIMSALGAFWCVLQCKPKKLTQKKKKQFDYSRHFDDIDENLSMDAVHERFAGTTTTTSGGGSPPSPGSTAAHHRVRRKSFGEAAVVPVKRTKSLDPNVLHLHAQ